MQNAYTTWYHVVTTLTGKTIAKLKIVYNVKAKTMSQKIFLPNPEHLCR